MIDCWHVICRAIECLVKEDLLAYYMFVDVIYELQDNLETQ